MAWQGGARRIWLSDEIDMEYEKEEEEASSSSNELSRSERYHRRSIMSTQISQLCKKETQTPSFIQEIELKLKLIFSKTFNII